MPEVIKIVKQRLFSEVDDNFDKTDEHAVDRAQAAEAEAKGKLEYVYKGTDIKSELVKDDKKLEDYAKNLNRPNQPELDFGGASSNKVIYDVKENVILKSFGVGDTGNKIKYPSNVRIDSTGNFLEIELPDDEYPEGKSYTPPVEAYDLAEHTLMINNGKIKALLSVDITPDSLEDQLIERDKLITILGSYGITNLGERFEKAILDNKHKLNDNVDYEKMVSLPEIAELFNYLVSSSTYTVDHIFMAFVTAYKYMSLSVQDREKYGWSVNDSLLQYFDPVIDILDQRNDAKKISKVMEITHLNFLPRIIKAAEQVANKCKWYTDVKTSVLTKPELFDTLFKTYKFTDDTEVSRAPRFSIGKVALTRPYAYGEVTYDMSKGDDLDKAKIENGFGGANITKHYYQTFTGQSLNDPVYLCDPILDGIQDTLNTMFKSTGPSCYGKANVLSSIDMTFSPENPEFAFLILYSLPKIKERYARIMDDLLKVFKLLKCENGYETFRCKSFDEMLKKIEGLGIRSYNTENPMEFTESNPITRFNYPSVARKVGSIKHSVKEEDGTVTVSYVNKYNYCPDLYSGKSFTTDNGIVKFTGRIDVKDRLLNDDKFMSIFKVIDPLLFVRGNDNYIIYSDGQLDFSKVSIKNVLKGRRMFGTLIPMPSWLYPTTIETYRPVKVANIRYSVSDEGESIIEDFIKGYNDYLNLPVDSSITIYGMKQSKSTVNGKERKSYTFDSGVKAGVQLNSYEVHYPLKFNTGKLLHVLVPNCLLTKQGGLNCITYAINRCNLDDENHDALNRLFNEIGIYNNKNAFICTTFQLLGLPIIPGESRDTSNNHCTEEIWSLWKDSFKTSTNYFYPISGSSGSVIDMDLSHFLDSVVTDFRIHVSLDDALDEAKEILEEETIVTLSNDYHYAPVENHSKFNYLRSDVTKK